MEEFNLFIRRGIFDRRPRQLIINSEIIRFEANNLSNNLFIQFNKEEILDYRYGIKWIKGIEFVIGREYQFFIRNIDKEIVKISFQSFYGYRKQELFNLYCNINLALWENFFVHKANNYIELFRTGKPFTIDKVDFFEDKLVIKTSNLVKKTEMIIPWDKVRTRDYQTYFAIYLADQETKINKAFSYLDDWNITVLYSVVRTILKDKGIET